MKILRMALVICAGLLAASCLPVSTTAPVGSTVGLGHDSALIGTWRVVPEKKSAVDGSEDGPGFVHFLRGKDNTMTALLVATGTADAKHAGEWSLYAVSTAKLSGHAYLNARLVSQDGKPTAGDDAKYNIPLLYRVSGKRAVFYLMNEDAVKAAIAAGKIEGRVGTGKFADVTLTSPPKALDKFFASAEGASLFTEKLMVLKRIK